MVAHSLGYGDLGGGRQMEGYGLREEGFLSLYQICSLLGKRHVPGPPDAFPSQTQMSVLFMSIPFSLATQSGGRSETRSFRDGQRTLFWVVDFFFVHN